MNLVSNNFSPINKMKKIHKINSLYFTVLFALLSFSVNAQNLLVNGDFEEKIEANNVLPSSWTSSDIQTSASLSLIKESIREGGEGVQAFKMSLDTVQSKIGDIIQVAEGIKPGKVYNVSFWYKYTKANKSDGSTGFRVLQWFDDADSDVPPIATDSELFGFEACAFKSINVWNKQNITVTAPTGAKKLLINISSGGVSDFIIDDVEIVRKKK